MPKIHEGMLRADGRRFAVVASRWNDFIGDKLIAGALDALRRTGASDEDVEIFRCPGAMEIPALTRRVVEMNRFDAVICLGVVIRGATPHFDLVVGEATAGVARIAATAAPAITFGVLACDSLEQAVERAGTKGGNRGFDAAMAAVEMADLFGRLSETTAISSTSGLRRGK